MNGKQVVKMEKMDFHTFRAVAEQLEDSPLATTNYFRSDRANKGFILLLRKCDNYHLVVPESNENAIKEFLTGKYAQVSFGTARTTVVFEDLSGNPMILQFDNQQILGLFDDAYDKPKRKGFLAIYKLGKKCVADIADEVVEVGRIDLWVNRTFNTNPYKIRKLTTEERNKYK